MNIIISMIPDFEKGLINHSEIVRQSGVYVGAVTYVLKKYMGEEKFEEAKKNSRRQTFNLNDPNIKGKMPIIIDKIISEGFITEELAEALGISAPTLNTRIYEYLEDIDPKKLKTYKQFMLARKERRVAIKTLDPDIKRIVVEKIDSVINGEISTGELTRMINKEFSLKYGRTVRIDANLIRRFIISCLDGSSKITFGRRIENKEELVLRYKELFEIECRKLTEFFEKEMENSETTVRCAKALTRCAEAFKEIELLIDSEANLAEAH